MQVHSLGVTRWMAAAAAYAALTAAMFFPVLVNVFSRIAHDPGDPLLNTWLLWWNAIAVPFTVPWWNGLAYWPLHDVLAFSEHLVGIAPISTSLIWLGVDPLITYNLLFLASWPVCALAAHALAYHLTGRHDAGFVAGLVFGFNPYRVAQTAHLQVLVAWWMPIALLALHQAVGTASSKRRAAWVAVFAAAWLLQSLTNGYLLFYFSIVVALWLAWFATAREVRKAGLLILLGWTIAAVPMIPILLKYRAVHGALGLSRVHREILSFSGDLTSFLAASELTALWRFGPSVGPEQELYQGIVATLLLAASIVLVFLRSAPTTKARRIWLVAVGATIAFALAAIVTAAIGPWSVNLGLFSLSGARFRKPLTMMVASAVVAVALSRRGEEAFRVRSTFVFYTAATILCWLMCLGPVGRFAGEPILEHPPYSWVIDLPGFNGLRVPTRFASVGTLMLAMAAAIGFSRIVASHGRAALFAAATMVALVADSWPAPIPTFAPPDSYRLPEGARSAAVVEIPVRGSIFGDVAAMYRAMRHGRPVVNGYSGHAPPPYEVLRIASAEGDISVLPALATYGPVCVVVDRRTNDPAVGAAVVEHGGRSIGADGAFAFYLLGKRLRPSPASTGRLDPRIVVSPSARRLDNRLFDGDLETFWTTRGAQKGSEWFTIPLSEPVTLSGVAMTLGERVLDYPRLLIVETSVDRTAWEPAWQGPTSSLAYLGAMDSPRFVRIEIPFSARLAARVRLRQIARGRNPWSIAELELLGARHSTP
jgi:hypothetical protein